ncbi:hypothetical protein D3C79_956040 [compost metagenome]
METTLQAAMHHLHLDPLLMCHPAKQLAAPVRAHRSDECCAADLLAHVQELRLVELLGPMHGEAVAGATERVGQHDHFGGIGAKMRVHVLGSSTLQPPHDTAGFSQVDQVIGPGSISAHPHAQRQLQR